VILMKIQQGRKGCLRRESSVLVIIGMAWHGMAWCAMEGKCNWRLELQTTLGGGVLALVLALPFRIGVGSVGFSRSVRCDAMRWLLVMKLNVF
jgi:hypothetical protein